jgi:8-oxo-dGTP pyrophosphatase MutT (NUDIX family)
MIAERVPFGAINPDKKNAVFLAIYVREISPWKYFKDEMSHKRCPAVIMIDRWDGRVGFPGGTVDAGETLLEALRREIKEEIGIKVRLEQVSGICSFDGKLTTHLYGLEVTEVEFMHIYYHILNGFSRSILLHAYEEGDDSHFLSEITGIKIVPILEHGGKGVNLFLENKFAGSSKEDMKVFLKEVLEYD